MDYEVKKKSTSFREIWKNINNNSEIPQLGFGEGKIYADFTTISANT